MISAILDLVDPQRSAHAALTVLTRLAQRQPEAEAWLWSAFRGRLTLLAVIALAVAVETGDPIGLVLAQEVEDHATEELAEWLEGLCDQPQYFLSLPLREIAVYPLVTPMPFFRTLLWASTICVSC